MGSYRNDCSKCGDAYITECWEPEMCPFCELDEKNAEIAQLRADIARMNRALADERASVEIAYERMDALTAERDARPEISREDAAAALVASGQFSDPDNVMDEWTPVLAALRAHAAVSGAAGSVCWNCAGLGEVEGATENAARVRRMYPCRVCGGSNERNGTGRISSKKAGSDAACGYCGNESGECDPPGCDMMADRCEGCEAPATGRTLDDVPICRECGESVEADTCGTCEPSPPPTAPPLLEWGPDGPRLSEYERKRLERDEASGGECKRCGGAGIDVHRVIGSDENSAWHPACLACNGTGRAGGSNA